MASKGRQGCSREIKESKGEGNILQVAKGEAGIIRAGQIRAGTHAGEVFGRPMPRAPSYKRPCSSCQTTGTSPAAMHAMPNVHSMQALLHYEGLNCKLLAWCWYCKLSVPF